jgi:hypothetical protein
VLVELVVVCVELDVEVELVVVRVELLVVDEVVVGVDEVVRTKYALTPATATMMMTMAAMAIRAIPPLSCGKKERVRATLFKQVENIFTFCIKI